MHSKGTFILVAVLIWSCNNITDQPITAPLLNDSVVRITKNFSDTTKYEQALDLLDQAINIDTNYFKSYANKLYFEESLGKFDNALETLVKMIKLKSDSAELYLKAGIYKDIIGDSVKAAEFYNRSLPRYTILFDTLKKDNPERNNVFNMLALNIIMLGHEKMFHDYLRDSCKTKLDSIFMRADVLGKTRNELLAEGRKKYIR